MGLDNPNQRHAISVRGGGSGHWHTSSCPKFPGHSLPGRTLNHSVGASFTVHHPHRAHRGCRTLLRTVSVSSTVDCTLKPGQTRRTFVVVVFWPCFPASHLPNTCLIHSPTHFFGQVLGTKEVGVQERGGRSK